MCHQKLTSEHDVSGCSRDEAYEDMRPSTPHCTIAMGIRDLQEEILTRLENVEHELKIMKKAEGR